MQQPKTITIGGKEYILPKPTVATIIMASEIISQLPYIFFEDDSIVQHVFANAKSMKPIGRLLAVLLMGAQAVTKAECKSRFSLKFWKNKSDVDKLADELLGNITTREFAAVVAELISNLDIAFFFGTITSLTRVNVLSPTKTESPTTQSGH